MYTTYTTQNQSNKTKKHKNDHDLILRLFRLRTKIGWSLTLNSINHIHMVKWQLTVKLVFTVRTISTSLAFELEGGTASIQPVLFKHGGLVERGSSSSTWIYFKAMIRPSGEKHSHTHWSLQNPEKRLQYWHCSIEKDIRTYYTVPGLVNVSNSQFISIECKTTFPLHLGGFNHNLKPLTNPATTISVNLVSAFSIPTVWG